MMSLFSKSKIGIILSMLAFSFNSLFAKVSITEIMQSNFGGVLDYYNEYPDSWVEVHNSSDQEIDLIGYSISEVNNVDSAYTLYESLEIPADGYALIYCDKENKRQHTDFRLNSDKPGVVYLWDNNGVLVEKSGSTEAVYFALLFEFDGDQKAIRHVLYNCNLSRPGIASQTKEDSIEPVTETLALTADPRADGLVKSRTGDDTDSAVYQGWYEAVYVPDLTVGNGEEEEEGEQT